MSDSSKIRLLESNNQTNLEAVDVNLSLSLMHNILFASTKGKKKERISFQILANKRALGPPMKEERCP